MPQRRFQEFWIWDTCCEFSLPTWFLTNWKMNEHVYISSTCLTQAGDQLGRLICSLSRAPAISSLWVSFSFLAARFLWSCQTFPPVSSASLLAQAVLSIASSPTACMHGLAHEVSPFLVLSLLSSVGLMFRGLRLSPFCWPLSELRADPDGVGSLLCTSIQSSVSNVPLPQSGSSGCVHRPWAVLNI